MARVIDMYDNAIKVVIVDEDTTILKMWERVFRIIDHCDYCLTNDPNMALALAKEKKVDLLISEVVMEKGNGFKLAESIHALDPSTQIVLTTTYDCDLKRFDLSDPKFHILYKPYHDIDDVIKFISDVINKKDPRTDADEDSWSENEEFPAVMEWKL